MKQFIIIYTPQYHIFDLIIDLLYLFYFYSNFSIFHIYDDKNGTYIPKIIDLIDNSYI